MIYLYTDGSVSRPKAGKSPGGWAFSYIHEGKYFRGSGARLDVTNNQMEMLAAIKGLQFMLAKGLKGSEVCIVSDSQYVVNGCSQWIVDWKRSGWVNSKGRKIINREFWMQLDTLSSNFKTRWKWVRGHMGNPENEVVDKLARAAAFRAVGFTEAAFD